MDTENSIKLVGEWLQSKPGQEACRHLDRFILLQPHKFGYDCRNDIRDKALNQLIALIRAGRSFKAEDYPVVLGTIVKIVINGFRRDGLPDVETALPEHSNARILESGPLALFYTLDHLVTFTLAT